MNNIYTLVDDFMQGKITIESLYPFRDDIYHEYIIQMCGKANPNLTLKDIQGKTILFLTYLQSAGHGDVFQYMRYLPILQKYNVNVVLDVHESIKPLMKGFKLHNKHRSPFNNYFSYFEVPILNTGKSPDYQISLFSIPIILNLPFQRYEQYIVYPNRPFNDGNIHVGICNIAGNPNQTSVKNKLKFRSIAMNLLSDILKTKGIKFHNLCDRSDEKDLQLLSSVDADSPKLDNWGMTASIISQMDLIITVDTAVAHLAGAMNKEVWLLLPREISWKWLLGLLGYPYYPSVKIYRQEKENDWEKVLSKVKRDLKSLSASF